MSFFKTILTGLKGIWDYFRPSWEDETNKFSYKRASQFIFMLLITRMIMNGIDNEWEFKALLVIATLFSLTAMVITVPQLLQAFKYWTKTKKVDYTTSIEEESTVTTETSQPIEPLPSGLKD